MLELKMDTTIISYSIRRSQRARYVSLSFDTDGVQVVAPIAMIERDIIALVEKRKQWIFSRLDRYRKRLMQIPAEREFVNGEMLLFMGVHYPLNVQEHKGNYTKINLTDGKIIVTINGDIPIEKRREEIRRKLEQWYIKRAKELITERLVLFSDKIGVKINTVRFKNQKTRWGSCSLKGNLNFNWKLVMAPLVIVDYVIVHELCHMKQMNHSPKFWRLVGTQISEYQTMRKWLKDNGSKLSL